MALFADIPRFIQCAGYAVDISWSELPRYYARTVTEYHLNVSPDFQRGYVWTPEQKVRYVEFILQGGATGHDIYTNCPDWDAGGRTDYVLVDGKQRLDAVLGFLNNEFPVFGGNFRRDYTDWIRHHARFKWHVNTLATRDEVLQWYIDLNSGGTVHSDEEIDRVRAMRDGAPFVRPTRSEVLSLAQLDRGVVREAIEQEERRIQESKAAQAALPVKSKSRKKGRG